ISVRVDIWGVQALMSEKIRNLLEAGSVSHEAAGHRVTEHVGTPTWGVDSGATKCADRSCSDGVDRERSPPMTSEMLNESPTLRRCRTPLAQIAGDRPTGLPRQWQHCASASFACSQP